MLYNLFTFTIINLLLLVNNNSNLQKKLLQLILKLKTKHLKYIMANFYFHIQ